MRVPPSDNGKRHPASFMTTRSLPASRRPFGSLKRVIQPECPAEVAYWLAKAMLRRGI